MKVVGLDWKRHEKRRGRSDVTTRKRGNTDDAGMLARVRLTAQVDSIIRTMQCTQKLNTSAGGSRMYGKVRDRIDSIPMRDSRLSHHL